VKYKPLYKPNQVICGYGNVVAVTGWSVKDAIAKRLDPNHYAAVGNLYSPTRGISPLLRNLLANPHVRFVVALDRTKEDRNAGGVQCLHDFFLYGYERGQTDTGKDAWVINSVVPGYIDQEIPAQALDRIRAEVTMLKETDLNEFLYRVNYLGTLEISPWGESKIYPLPSLDNQIKPGDRYGHRIEGRTIAETWVKILHRIKTTGTIRPTGYDGQWQELINLIAVVTDEPKDFYFPEPNYLPLSRSFLRDYIPQILDDAPYQEGVKYTYGQRLRSWFKYDQIEQVIEKLIGEIDAASGVMSLWDVQDHIKGGSPCLNHIWCRVVDNELSLTATFRSNDMFSAWPANAMGLRALQWHIRDEISDRSDYDLSMGPLITISQSAHIYDDTWENVDQLLAKQYKAICDYRDYGDPSGSFLVSVEGGHIVVIQITPGGGEEVFRFEGSNARQLYQRIAMECPAIQCEHALYLGTELQKAETSLRHGFSYTQDKPLKFRVQ